MRIAAVGSKLPDHHYDQQEILQRLEREWQGKLANPDRLRRLHQNVLVGGRRLAVPMERYDELTDFTDSNNAWIDAATTLGADAVQQVLEAGTAVDSDVFDSLGSIFFVSVTGLAVPSIDARVINRLRLPTTLRRVPIFGLGCVAGAAGIARLSDDLRAHPKQAGLLLSVELCSLTLQRQDLSIANLISSGLFGDGAAAVLMLGQDHPAYQQTQGPRVIDTQSVFFPDSERVMGWDIGADGFQVVLSATVPQVVEQHLPQAVDALLERNNLSRRSVERWICHPGGPRVLEAMQRSLDLPEGALERTWKSLREVGNLSSSSVLMILASNLEEPPPAGSPAILLAMGPGFCAELVLLEF